MPKTSFHRTCIACMSLDTDPMTAQPLLMPITIAILSLSGPAPVQVTILTRSLPGGSCIPCSCFLSYSLVCIAGYEGNLVMRAILYLQRMLQTNFVSMSKQELSTLPHAILEELSLNICLQPDQILFKSIKKWPVCWMVVSVVGIPILLAVFWWVIRAPQTAADDFKVLRPLSQRWRNPQIQQVISNIGTKSCVLCLALSTLLKTPLIPPKSTCLLFWLFIPLFCSHKGKIQKELWYCAL